MITRMKGAVAALALAATLAGGAAMAQSGNYSWPNQNRQWFGWSQNFCSLSLVDVFQPNADQPIHLKVRNNSHQRLQYTISVQVGAQSGSISVDNANPGETSERPTSNGFRGNLRGERVVLRVTSCQIRS